MNKETEVSIDLIETIEQINEELSFNNNNSDVVHQDHEIISTIEAENHTTIEVIINIFILKLHTLNLKDYILEVYEKAIEEFDVDNEFDSLWSSEFGRHNGFSPREFIAILEEDEAYFKNQLNELRNQK
ncbi:hypothetical protein [Staphylococcus haemolyticus]|uniref:Uncharacterized protein n=1 Tax=Staphylococcus haemolyticus TaxID=1283 RepID=A0A2K0AX49_STAHA|nr:hypothetical protein [Staphylococcus haemolyticus]MCH4519537.1 hypothetical protein [Staphylococcus haemolyticus]PNN29606.1 hypothetical protein AL503_002165 [Staphylococcus haemolyticus]